MWDNISDLHVGYTFYNILDLSGQFFLKQNIDAQMNLKAQGLKHTIKDNTSTVDQEMMLLHK